MKKNVFVNKNRIVSIVLGVLLVLSLGIFSPNYAKAISEESNANVLVTIYTTNDVHGYIDQCVNDETGASYGLSYANVAKLKKDAGGNGILVDAGDHTSGGLYANYDWGYTMVDLLKASYYDLAVPGNHEFDFGMDSFFRADKHAADTSKAGYGSYNYYACNLFHVDPATQQKSGLVLEPYKVVTTTSGLKVAFVGVMTPETISKSSPAYFQDAEGRYIYTIDGTNDMYADFEKAVDDASKVADVVIGIGHLGDNTEESGGNTSKALVENTKANIAAFIDGHSHSVYTTTWKNAAGIDVKALQTGTAFTNVGKISILENASNDGYTVNTELLASSTFNFTTRDANVLALEKAWKKNVDSKYEGELAIAQYPFWFSEGNVKSDDSKRWVRRFETNLTDLIADSLYWTSNFTDCGGADLAILNGGAIRNYIDQHDVISPASIAQVLPFPNQFGIATFSGSLLREALEFSYRNYGKYDTDGLFIENGGLMSTSGIQFSVDPNKDSTVVVNEETGEWISGPTDGQYRIQNIKIYNKQTGTYDDIDLNKRYKVAGITYFFKNYGDGFNMFRNKEVSIESFDLAPYATLVNYLSAFGSASTNTLPVINSTNCPLNVLPNFQLNYENMFGANRVGAYNVTFDTNGGSYIPSQNVLYNEPVLKPSSDPTKDGYMFDGWYVDNKLSEQFDFATPVESDSIVYAKWAEVPTPDPGTGSDVSSNVQTSDLMLGIFLILLLCFAVSGSALYIKKKNSDIYANAKHLSK